MTHAPSFPPLLTGMPVQGGDPFAAAIAHAKQGGDPAHVFWSDDAHTLRAAITLAPEMTLADAMGGVFAVQLGANDALGALIPAELAVQFDWPEKLLVNGAHCGGFRAAASTNDPTQEPDWLVVGLEIPILPRIEFEPGLNPNATTLTDEGCGGISSGELIESWARHSLVWLNSFMDDGIRPLHEAWHGKCDRIGSDVSDPKPGKFVGLDDSGAMILQTEAGTELIPLTSILEPTP